MAKTTEELLAQAALIRDNVTDASNTHTLVGSLLVDMVDKEDEDITSESSARSAADTALSLRMDAWEQGVDAAPTEGSTNLVRSSGIYTYGEGIRSEARENLDNALARIIVTTADTGNTTRRFCVAEFSFTAGQTYHITARNTTGYTAQVHLRSSGELSSDNIVKSVGSVSAGSSIDVNVSVTDAASYLTILSVQTGEIEGEIVADVVGDYLQGVENQVSENTATLAEVTDQVAGVTDMVVGNLDWEQSFSDDNDGTSALHKLSVPLKAGTVVNVQVSAEEYGDNIRVYLKHDTGTGNYDEVRFTEDGVKQVTLTRDVAYVRSYIGGTPEGTEDFTRTYTLSVVGRLSDVSEGLVTETADRKAADTEIKGMFGRLLVTAVESELVTNRVYKTAGFPFKAGQTYHITARNTTEYNAQIHIRSGEEFDSSNIVKSIGTLSAGSTYDNYVTMPAGSDASWLTIVSVATGSITGTLEADVVGDYLQGIEDAVNDHTTELAKLEGTADAVNLLVGTTESRTETEVTPSRSKMNIPLKQGDVVTVRLDENLSGREIRVALSENSSGTAYTEFKFPDGTTEVTKTLLYDANLMRSRVISSDGTEESLSRTYTVIREGKVTAVEEKVDEIEENLGNVTTRVTAVEEKVDDIVTDNVLVSALRQQQVKEGHGVLRLLLLGNSYSANLAGLGSLGPWGYLGNALHSIGIDVDVTVGMSPGASLNDYWNHINGSAMRNQLDIYRWTYRKNGASSCEVENDVTLDYILGKRDYDIVVQQQASTYAADYSKYVHYGEVRDYIASKLGRKPFFMWHVVWNRIEPASPQTQYADIVAATKSLIDDYGLLPNQIIASGEVVNLAETQDMNLHQDDGVHLNADGKWMIGLAFIKRLLDTYYDDVFVYGKTLADITYEPANLSYSAEAKTIAAQACENINERFFSE